VVGLSRPPAHDVSQHEVERVAMKQMNFCFYAFLLQTNTSSNVVDRDLCNYVLILLFKTGAVYRCVLRDHTVFTAH
jgi:hypothetical protein